MNDKTFISLFKASVVTLLGLVALAIAIEMILPIDDPIRWPPKTLDAETEYYLPDVDIYIKSINKPGKNYIAFSSEPFVEGCNVDEYIRILQPYKHFTFYIELYSNKLLLYNTPDITEPHFSNFETIYLGDGFKEAEDITDADNEYLPKPGYIAIRYDGPYVGSLFFYSHKGLLPISSTNRRFVTGTKP